MVIKEGYLQMNRDGGHEAVAEDALAAIAAQLADLIVLELLALSQ